MYPLCISTGSRDGNPGPSLVAEFLPLEHAHMKLVTADLNLQKTQMPAFPTKFLQHFLCVQCHIIQLSKIKRLKIGKCALISHKAICIQMIQ